MDNDRAKLLVQLLSKLPLIARVTLLHMLQVSPPSKYVDLRTELTVAVLRSFITPSSTTTITGTQKALNRDPGVKGRIWIAKYAAPVPPEPSIRDAVVRAVEAMRTDGADSSPGPPPPLKDVQWPEVAPVEAEWTGYRKGASTSSRLPPITEAEKYGEMMKEVASPVTVLYFHGGAYYLLDPATHRAATKKIAKLTGGRCYSVRYRLAPQNPFPAALIDALQSYLALLHPPPGAFHEAVKPEHIVFAGDRCVGLPVQPSLVVKEINTRLTKTKHNKTAPGEISAWHSPSYSSSSSAPTPKSAGTDRRSPCPSRPGWPSARPGWT